MLWIFSCFYCRNQPHFIEKMYTTFSQESMQPWKWFLTVWEIGYYTVMWTIICQVEWRPDSLLWCQPVSLSCLKPVLRVCLTAIRQVIVIRELNQVYVLQDNVKFMLFLTSSSSSSLLFVLRLVFSSHDNVRPLTCNCWSLYPLPGKPIYNGAWRAEIDRMIFTSLIVFIFCLFAAWTSCVIFDVFFFWYL